MTNVVDVVDSLNGFKTINGMASAEWTWVCGEHAHAGTASSKQEAKWLAESHEGYYALHNATPADLANVNENGIPLVSFEELSGCKITYVKGGKRTF